MKTINCGPHLARRAAVLELLSGGVDYCASEPMVVAALEREDALLAATTYLAAGGNPGLLFVHSTIFSLCARLQDQVARTKAEQVAAQFGRQARHEVSEILWPTPMFRFD